MVEALADVRARAAVFATQMSERLEKEDVPFDVQESEAEPVDGLLMAARYADLVIVGLDSPGPHNDSRNAAMIGALAVAGASPVLALPETASIRLDVPVLIAWKDSAEAANAVRAAVPLLKQASAVQVLTVSEHDGQPMNADPVLRYLSRHDVHARQVDLPKGYQTVEETIEAAAGTHNAGLIVMGAYGHSRMRELLFGGVTRYLIDCGKFPLFMTH